MFIKRILKSIGAAINRMGVNTFGTCLIGFLAGLMMIFYSGPDAYNLLITIVSFVALVVGLWPPRKSDENGMR